MHYKIKFTEYFKDGQIFGSREFRPGDIEIVDEQTMLKVKASGAEFDILEQMIKKVNVEKKDAGKK